MFHRFISQTTSVPNVTRDLAGVCPAHTRPQGVGQETFVTGAVINTSSMDFVTESFTNCEWIWGIIRSRRFQVKYDGLGRCMDCMDVFPIETHPHLAVWHVFMRICNIQCQPLLNQFAFPPSPSLHIEIGCMRSVMPYVHWDNHSQTFTSVA